MTYDIGAVSLEELDILAQALDHYLCNAAPQGPDLEITENLFATLDIMSDDARERSLGNVLFVDFEEKNG